MQRFYTLLLVLGLSWFSACQPDAQDSSSQTPSEVAINPQIKRAIDSLNQVVVQGLFENDPVPIEAFMSQPLLEQSGIDIDLLSLQVSGIINSAQFEVFDEYYLTDQLKAPLSQTYSGGTADDAFSIKFKSLTDEAYISILALDEPHPDHLLTLLYGKYETGWRLNIIQFGQYAYLGQQAPALWRAAEEKEVKQHWVDAANLLSLAMKSLKPADKFWEYREEDNIRKTYERVMQQVNALYQFPVVVEAVPKQPRIFGIYPQVTAEGIFPMIEYTTQISMEDSVSLQQENDLLHQQIGTVFPGIDQEKAYLLYRAYDSIPDGKRQPVFYGFLQNLPTSP